MQRAGIPGQPGRATLGRGCARYGGGGETFGWSGGVVAVSPQSVAPSVTLWLTTKAVTVELSIRDNSYAGAARDGVHRGTSAIPHDGDDRDKRRRVGGLQRQTGQLIGAANCFQWRIDQLAAAASHQY